MQVRAAQPVAVDLNVHDDRIRLLDLADLAELYAIAEAGGEVGAEGIAAHVSRGAARHQEEDCGAADENHQHQEGGDPSQRKGEVAMFVSVIGMACVNISVVPGAAHFHQDKRTHGHHHERGEGEQEDAVDGQDSGRQHHQEGEDGQGDVIAFTAQREHTYDDAEQGEVNRSG